MNWLLLCSNPDETVDIKNFLKGKGSKPVTTVLTSDLSVKKLKKQAQDATHCVAVLSSKEAVLPQMLHAAGFFAGKGLPVFVIITDNPSQEIKDYIDLYKTFSLFKTTEKLIESLTDNYPLFLAEEERQRAHVQLFNDGIPFTPDCFSTYIAKGNEEICQLFLDAGMDINSRDSAGTPMLSIAARSGRENMIQWLCSNGASINETSMDRGYTAIMDAVWKGSVPIVEKLISLGADLNKVGNDGQTALIIATGSNNVKICRQLIEHGADPTVEDRMGMSSLKYAELFKKTELVDLYKEFIK